MIDGPSKNIDWAAVLVWTLVVLAGFVLTLYASGVGSGFVYGNI